MLKCARWDKAHKLLIEYKMHRQIVQDSVRDAAIVLRAGLDLFGEMAARKHVPMLVFSAGLGGMCAWLVRTNNAVRLCSACGSGSNSSCWLRCMTVCVDEILQQSNMARENMFIVSNRMFFDDDGALTGMCAVGEHSTTGRERALFCCRI